MPSLRQAKRSAEPNQASKSVASFVVDTITARIKYYEEKSLTSGWTQLESGVCCDKCSINMKEIARSGRAVGLRMAVGCRNPFQLESVCQCHIPTRRAVIRGITNALSQLISTLGDNAEEFRYSGGVRANTKPLRKLAPKTNSEANKEVG